MTEFDSSPPIAPEPGEDRLSEAERNLRRLEKERARARNAWWAFAGRVVAQIVGALATVALGVLVAERLRLPAPAPGPAAVVRSSPTNPDAPVQASIAVLPITNLSGKPDQDFLADGLTEALITDLARIRSLKVISRTSVMQFKGQVRPVPEIGRELGVAYVLEGSMAAGNGRIRVTAQLIDAATDVHLWTETYDRKASDILSLQDDVSRRIAREVNVVLTPDEAAHFSRPSVDPETHALYLRGRYDLHQGGANGATKAIETFEAVLARDPQHARALSSLAEAWILAASSIDGAVDPRTAFPKARDAALRAIAIDPRLGGPHVALANVLYQTERDFVGAEKELHRALELNPGNAAARRALSLLLANLGRFDEAVAEALRVVELDPLSLVKRQNLALVLYFAGRFEEAEKEARAAREDGTGAPGFREFVAEVQLASGRPRVAIDEMKRVFGGEPRSDGARALWGAAHAAAGDVAVARRILSEFNAQKATRYVPPRSLLLLEVGLGLRDEAFATIDRAISEGSDIVHVLKVHPLLRPLRDDPRFKGALQRAGFPKA